MSSIDLALNEDQIFQFESLNQFFEENRSVFTKILSFDNLVNEAHALGTIESSIPEGLRYDLHIDMILNKKVTDYYTTMSSGTNVVLEAARKIFPGSTQITESIENFREYLISLINEDALALGMPTGSISMTPPMVPRKGGGFWGTLKSLWNAVTEGGSVIGIVQFIIDIIGLVGDFIFPGVGVVADLLNAAIYAIRGEWILCAISVIAAVVIGAGDSLKLFKSFAKPAEKVMAKLAIAGGAEEGAKVLSKMGAKESGGVMKLLSGISGFIAGAMGKATSLLGKFFNAFGKVTGYIPGLGKLLKPMFEGLGKVISKFGEKMSIFSANLKLMKKGGIEAAEMSIEQATKAGGDFIFDGPWVKVVNKEGKEIAKYPAKKFEELAARKAGSKVGADILGGPAGVAATTRTLAKPSVRAGFLNRFKLYFKEVAGGAGIIGRTFGRTGTGMIRFTKDLPFFLGKQIYKIAFKSDWVNDRSAWSRDEVEGHGNGALNDWINDRITKERKKSGAVYLPYVELDSSDEEAMKKISEYQNHLAKQYGQPSIIKVISKNKDSEKTETDFNKFFDEIAKGDVEHSGEGDKSAHSLGSMSESKLGVKTIFNFSDFKG
jgi:hypothetical protein